jgi:hypothetical protein
MDKAKQSAISRLVAHHSGPTAVARLLQGAVSYQQVGAWVQRGWASPMHILRLEPLLPEGMTIRDLHLDRPDAAPAAGAPVVTAPELEKVVQHAA